MQRLVEQSVGDGAVFDGFSRVARVRYHLAVCQHFSEVEGESVPANLVVEGRITALDGLEVGHLHQRACELTLLLADGRLLDFLIADEDGTSRSTGRRLY